MAFLGFGFFFSYIKRFSLTSVLQTILVASYAMEFRFVNDS